MRRADSRLWDLPLLFAITAVGVVVRLLSPARIGLWRDEVQALNIAALPDLGAITRFLYHHESHPPLFYYLIHGLGWLTGDMTASLRLLVFISSIALIPAVWWFARQVGVRGTAPIASALVAISLPTAFFTVELRPYSLIALGLVLSTGSLLNALHGDATRWRASWTVLAICLLYLHHVGLLILGAQLAYLALVSMRDHVTRKRVAGWWPWFVLLALLAGPDLILLLHQNSVAGVPAFQPVTVLHPLAALLSVTMAFPGEVAISLAGAVLALGSRGRLRQIAILFLLTIACLTLASYRAQFIQAYILMAFAPLGMTCAAGVLATLARRRSRWRLVALAEVGAVCVALSAHVMLDATKGNTEEMALAISARALGSDLLILVPGAYGPSFNQYFRGAQSQVNYPVVGQVARYEFDHDFEHMSSLDALQTVTDSMLAACSAGRRVWLIMPANWLVPGTPPVVLSRSSFGGLGQADVARANLLNQRARRLFGPEVQKLRPPVGSRGVEMLQALLYGPRNEGSDTTDAGSCFAE